VELLWVALRVVLAIGIATLFVVLSSRLFARALGL
jgi:hypothetical protein